MFYFVILIQTAINTGIGIGAILLAGQCLEVWLLIIIKKKMSFICNVKSGSAAKCSWWGIDECNLHI